MDMKLRGMYIARQLSFHGVSFKIEDVPIDEHFKKAYDDSVELVRMSYILLSRQNNNYFMFFFYIFGISGLKQCKNSLKRLN